MKRTLLFCLTLSALVFARPSLQIDRERIEAGQTFGLQLVIPIQELPAERGVPQLETRNGFTLMGLDSSDQVMRPSMEDMFNSFFGGGGGSYKARIYNFKIRAPKKTGQIDVGQMTWEIGGQVQNISSKIPVSVQRAYADDALAVSLTPSKKSIYEGEQFYVTLGFHTYEHFEGGLQATDMSTGNDFIVHRSDLNNMEFKPVEGSRREMQASAKFAWLSPTKSGNLQIPPFKFKYTKRGEPKIVEEKKQMGGMSFSSRSIKQESVEAEATSPTINITVKPLPAEGKPENFSGMVGDYKFTAEFDRTNLKVGEALTLSINIRGDGTPGTITDPKLPDFGEFRSVPPENNISKKIAGSKVITSKEIRVFLYPKKKGSFSIPEISYSWFNPAKKKYETATAGPWTIDVEKGDASAEAVFQTPAATAGPAAVQKQEIESLGSDIRHIHSLKDVGESAEPYKSAIFWIIFAAAIPFYLVVNFEITRRRKRSNNAALIRKGKANKMLKNRFASAREALKNGDAKALFAALENGLIDYLSDMTNLEFKGMTRPQMKDELARLGVNGETITAIDSWLEKCAFARFAPVNPTTDEQKKMLADIEKLCGGLDI
ncbi:BatD family protein [Fibrobacter sp. UBA4309]|uniref:BatD family protein n=1 Tax=Fibrobacter sp. UBA4309 TaxID=1946537 RepID=UPI0025B90C7A|nr:BatD family protein [Fibrobacter sp. UBA4309]